MSIIRGAFQPMHADDVAVCFVVCLCHIRAVHRRHSMNELQ